MEASMVKFEHSPADSLADSFGSPGTSYPSLFDESETMDPSDVMTPGFEDDGLFDHSTAATPSSDKKQIKKRKSWGQQLPEPKTNLPPRKRAKTEDEKEQRRVERVLRNRRAAQSSRERKRMEVEALESEKRQIERRAQDLEMRLAESEAQNALLQQRIAQMSAGMTVFNTPTPHMEQYKQAASPTFSQDLFGSAHAAASSTTPSRAFTSTPEPPVKTVNPASLSPELRPVPETSNASPSDLTQHPAAVLCDLQCQSDGHRPWTSTAAATTQPRPSTSTLISCLLLISAATSAFLSPLSAIMNSLSTGSSLSPTASLLSTIIWLATTPTALTTTTSSTSSTRTRPAPNSRRPRPSLRINLLRRLLACSPHLARPLMDATMGALRSASEQQLASPASADGGRAGRAGGSRADGEPSIACLMTLLWAVQVIDRERRLAGGDVPGTRRAAGQGRRVEVGALLSARPVSYVDHEMGAAWASADKMRVGRGRWAFGGEGSH